MITPLIPDAKQALADLAELFSLANVSAELAVRIEKVLEEFPPLRVADVDRVPAVGATHGVVVYALSEQLHGLLTAARISTGNGDANEIDGDKPSHDVAPVCAQMLLSDDEAISRMANCLMEFQSVETDGIQLASLQGAEELVKTLLHAALPASGE